MTPIEWALPAAIAAAMLATFLGVRARGGRRDRLARRLLIDSKGAEAVDLQGREAAGALGRFDLAFARLVWRSGLEISTAGALGLIALAGAAGAGLVAWLRLPEWSWPVGFAAGAALPVVGLLLRRGAWRRSIEMALPDSYSLLARSMRAGMSFRQALANCGEYGEGPLAKEFRLVVARVELGLPIPDALEGMARRVGLLDVDVLVSVVALHQGVGGNLAHLLDRLAAGVRDRNQFRGYLRAATSVSRATALFIGAAHPVLVILYLAWQPEMFARFFQSSAGWTAFLASVVLEIVGIAWLAVLLRVEY